MLMLMNISSVCKMNRDERKILEKLLKSRVKGDYGPVLSSPE